MYWDTSMNDNELMEQELEEMELNSCAPLCALHDLAQAVSEYEGKKNLPPQNISLACRLFEAGDNSSEDSGRTFDLALKLPKKNTDRGPVPEGSHCLEASNSHEALEGKSWPIVSAGPSKPLFSKQLLVHLLRTTFLPFEALFCL